MHVLPSSTLRDNNDSLWTKKTTSVNAGSVRRRHRRNLWGKRL